MAERASKIRAVNPVFASPAALGTHDSLTASTAEMGQASGTGKIAYPAFVDQDRQGNSRAKRNHKMR